jgi:hypothetical protein
MLKNLNHERFCQTYMFNEMPRIRYNATRSYMKVYPKASYKTALVNGSVLLKKVRPRIDELFNEKEEKC